MGSRDRRSLGFIPLSSCQFIKRCVLVRFDACACVFVWLGYVSQPQMDTVSRFNLMPGIKQHIGRCVRWQILLAGKETARWPRDGLCTIYHFPSAPFEFCRFHLTASLWAPPPLSLSLDHFCVLFFFYIAFYLLLKFNPTSIKISFVKRARWAFNRVSLRICLFFGIRCHFLCVSVSWLFMPSTAE